MIKASELMVGDKVLHDGKYKEVITIWPRSVSLYDSSQTWGSIYADNHTESEIEPIPLTPEILEKNGFELRREIVWRWISDDERTSIRIVLGAEHMYIIKNAYYEDEVEFSLPCPNVVHELQHCLKVVGIDKEIIL